LLTVAGAKVSLAQIKTSVPLTEKAYRAIKEAILSLQLQPGAALVEQDLASQLGISKIPLREALHQLENDGLVRRIPYKGVYVSNVSVKEAAEIAAIRGVLEGLAARLAAKRLTDEQLEQAEAILDEAEHALQQEDRDLSIAKGKEFHDFIIERCGNSELAPILETLDNRFHRFRLLSNEIRGRTAHSLREHRRVLKALKRRDPDAVERAMREHLTSVSIDLEKEAK
jgi:DNA-binding GntR family transcriptional regulator